MDLTMFESNIDLVCLIQLTQDTGFIWSLSEEIVYTSCRLRTKISAWYKDSYNVPVHNILCFVVIHPPRVTDMILAVFITDRLIYTSVQVGLLIFLSDAF